MRDNENVRSDGVKHRSVTNFKFELPTYITLSVTTIATVATILIFIS
jgi:hypothetical protein